MIKNTADLTTENAAVITSETAPESITPVTDGAMRQDLIDSMYNRADGLLGMSIPALFTGLSDGDDIEAFIQSLLTVVSEIDINSGNSMVEQGQPGQFLAQIDAGTNQLFSFNAGSPSTLLATLILANDSKDGAFDNGNNWTTSAYVFPGVNQWKFLMTAIELELKSVFFSGTIALGMVAKICKNGTAVATITGGQFTEASVITDKIYIPQHILASVVYATTDKITIEIWTGTATGGGSLSGVFKANTGTFSNEN